MWLLAYADDLTLLEESEGKLKDITNKDIIQ